MVIVRDNIAFVSIFNTAFVLMLMEMISLMLKLWTIIVKVYILKLNRKGRLIYGIYYNSYSK